MSPHQSGRRRYAERAAAETVSNAPAVGHQRASDKRIQISAAEADAMIAREATKRSPGPAFVERCTDGTAQVTLIDGNMQRSIPVDLFHAAADLLEALTDILRETEGGAHGCAGAFIARACNAIAKAKGNA